MPVTPSESVTYTITAKNSFRTATDSATVTVTYPAQTVTISVKPGSVYVGDAVRLTWISTGALSAAIDQGVGGVPVNGYIDVDPQETTVYTVTVTGRGGTAAAGGR